MSKNLRGPLLAAIFTTGLAGAFAAPAGAETLADAIALAYETNPTLQAQRAGQRALDETYVQARSGWRPQVSLSDSTTYSDNAVPRAARTLFNSSLKSNTGNAALNLTQPIWTGGRTAAAVSAAEADILSGRESLRRVEAQVILNVVQAYVDVRRDQDGVRIRQRNVAVLQKQLEESKARFDVGEITRTDVAQSQSRLAAAQALLQSAMAQFAISRANYAAVVGQNPGELADVPSLDFLLPGNADDAFAVAEKFNPLLRAQEYAEQASRARVSAARAERLPSLSLRATLGFSGVVSPAYIDRWSRNVTGAATLTVPLFAGGLTSSRIRQSVERNNVDRITIEAQRRAVLQSVTQAWNQLVASRANIDSTGEAVRAAQIAAEGTRQEQQVGLRTTLDVLNAEQELRNNELSASAARHDEYLSAATVLSAMGRLEARNLVPTLAQYDSKSNFRRLRLSWGWTPWEEPISVIDRVLSAPPIPRPMDKPGEAAIGPGLQPPPTVTPASPRK
ncbi:TolC family outer membrane protein [Phenylobacterium sp.]|uniref:TolC family outer membrane protein n=1 Tax=Phenylobacterium sp. TaxID=1871053 RepID=UPI00286CA5B4|nr:TolC family outer membrane protein [Phenylobacterium sp.]